jgi:hypothetical protein
MSAQTIPAVGVPVPLTRRELSDMWSLYVLARRHRNGEPVPERVRHAQFTVSPGSIAMDLAPAGVAVELKTRRKKPSDILMSMAPADWVPKSDVVCGTWTVTDRERVEKIASVDTNF